MDEKKRKHDPRVQLAADQWLDGNTTASVLGVSRTHLYPMIERGALVPYKIGSLTVYRRDDVVELAAARQKWAGR